MSKAFLEHFEREFHRWGERFRSSRRERRFIAGHGQYTGFFSAGAEIRALFKDWLSHVYEDIRRFSAESGRRDAQSIAAEFKISEKSAAYFLRRMAEDNFEKSESSENPGEPQGRNDAREI